MIDSKTIAPTRPAGAGYAASHISGTATPTNGPTRPRWRSLACPVPNAAIDLTLAPKYAAMTLEHETE
jgi:hypothetical protein